MNSDFNEALQRVAEESFEELAFILPVQEEEFCGERDGPKVAAAVRFVGPLIGEVYLVLPESMLPELASNMLGLDGDDPSVSQRIDALKELANVISGHILPAIAGDEAVFNVFAPETLSESEVPDCLHGSPPAGKVTLLLDSGAVDVVLFAKQTEALLQDTPG